jgi:cytochrome c oxidase cbb3-type subunit III
MQNLRGRETSAFLSKKWLTCDLEFEIHGRFRFSGKSLDFCLMKTTGGVYEIVWIKEMGNLQDTWCRKVTFFVIFAAAIFLSIEFFGGFPVNAAQDRGQDQAQSRQADRNQNAPSRSGSTVGEKAFASTCAACHGLDGQGSDKAPNIAGSDKVQHYSDARLSSIISNGVPGTAMPGFQDLGADKIVEIVSYLRILQGKHEARALPGDAKRGKEIFFGKGGCSSCHIVFGAGGFLGPDLSAFGSATSAQAVVDNILSTDRNPPPGYRSAVVTTRDGKRLEGLIRNEDNFSLQLQGKDGTFYFFQKSELQNIDRPAQSIMPTNYRERLTADELNDLVNYMVNGGLSKKQARVSPDDGDEDDFE